MALMRAYMRAYPRMVAEETLRMVHSVQLGSSLQMKPRLALRKLRQLERIANGGSRRASVERPKSLDDMRARLSLLGISIEEAPVNA